MGDMTTKKAAARRAAAFMPRYYASVCLLLHKLDISSIIAVEHDYVNAVSKT